MSHDIDTLNRLIGRLRAAARGYRAAGEGFGPQGAAHDATAEALASEVRDLGGAPAEAPGFDLARHAWSELPCGRRNGARGRRPQTSERAEGELLARIPGGVGR